MPGGYKSQQKITVCNGLSFIWSWWRIRCSISCFSITMIGSDPIATARHPASKNACCMMTLRYANLTCYCRAAPMRKTMFSQMMLHEYIRLKPTWNSHLAAHSASDMTPAGLEPAVPGSVGRCLIHWATGPMITLKLDLTSQPCGISDEDPADVLRDHGSAPTHRSLAMRASILGNFGLPLRVKRWLRLLLLLLLVDVDQLIHATASLLHVDDHIRVPRIELETFSVLGWRHSH